MNIEGNISSIQSVNFTMKGKILFICFVVLVVHVSYAKSLSISDVLLSTDDLHDDFEIVLRRKRNEALATEDTKLNLFYNIIRSHRKKRSNKKADKESSSSKSVESTQSADSNETVKVREVGVIAAAARLVSVMKRKLNRRAALIQGKLPRRKLTVTNRQTEHELHCIDRFDGRTGNNKKN